LVANLVNKVHDLATLRDGQAMYKRHRFTDVLRVGHGSSHAD
jgi:hypothetical protein